MSGSPTLFHDAYAPITSAIGFLRAPLDAVSETLCEWRREIHGSARTFPLAGGLEENILALEPLTGGVRPRELVVATRNSEWTATFDCGIQGDPKSTISFMATRLRVQGVAIVSIPDVRKSMGGVERYGARQFEMFSPIATDFMNYVRVVSVVRNGAKWRFDVGGTPQDFEDLEAYRQRRVADRFSSSMLIDYAAELGLRPFDERFFPGPCSLIVNPATSAPGGVVLSLREARRWSGITSNNNHPGPGAGK